MVRPIGPVGLVRFSNIGKDFILLECYILRLLVLKKCIILKDVSSMTFCYTLKGFMLLGDFDFMKLV